MKIVFQIGKKPVCAIHYKETNRTTQKKMTHNKCMTVVDLFELAQSQVEVIFKKKKKNASIAVLRLHNNGYRVFNADSVLCKSIV